MIYDAVDYELCHYPFSVMGESEDSTCVAGLYLDTNDLFDE